MATSSVQIPARQQPDVSLRISEVFFSLQGESRSAGLPTAFIRLTGCPLRCHYCDTAYAFTGGEQWSLEQVQDRLRGYRARHVCVTGGEPLAQPGCTALLTTLCDAGYNVSLETSGALSIAGVDSRVSIVLDLKTPASGECSRNLMSNIPLLKPADQVKFVICDRKDYNWARATAEQYDLASRVDEVLFSPSYEELAPAELAEWILNDSLPVRMQLQLHKLIWGDKPGV